MCGLPSPPSALNAMCHGRNGAQAMSLSFFGPGVELGTGKGRAPQPLLRGVELATVASLTDAHRRHLGLNKHREGVAPGPMQRMAAPGAAQFHLMKQSQCLRLAWGQWLFNSATAEVCILGGPRKWSLRFDDRELGYLEGAGADCAGGAQWALKFLQHVVYTDGGGGMYCRSVDENGDSVATSLSDLRGRRTPPKDVELNVAPLRILKLSVGVWHLRQQGCQCWVQVNNLYASLELESQGYSGRWLAHGWAAWAKWGVESLGLPACHFRGQIARDWCLPDLNRHQAPAEVMEQKSLSAHAFVALLCRWGSGNRRIGLQREGDAEKCNHALRLCLVEIQLRFGPIGFDIYGAHAEWSSDGPHTGCMTASVVLDGASLDTRAFARAFGCHRPEVMAALPSQSGHESECMIKLMSSLVQSRKCVDIFKQIVWVVGALLDQVLAERTAQVGEGVAFDTTSKAVLEKGLMQYMVAGRRALADQSFLSVALDGSRVGQKQIYAGMLCTPENIGWVFPPQAIDLPIVWRFSEWFTFRFTKSVFVFSKNGPPVRKCQKHRVF